MKKRVLSFVLAACMTFSMLPISALADFAENLSVTKTQYAHADCDLENAITINMDLTQNSDAETELRAALAAESIEDVVMTGGSQYAPVEVQLSDQLVVNGTKHLWVENWGGVTLGRGEDLLTKSLISVSAGAHLILGNGQISYEDDTLEASAQKGNYEVAQAGGALVLDGYAVWDGGEWKAFDKANPNFTGDDTGKTAVLYNTKDGQQYIYDNLDLVASEALIDNYGTLDIWGNTTLQDNVKKRGQEWDYSRGGSAIYSPSGSELNLYDGVIQRCASVGNVDAGQGAVFVGEIVLSGSEWTTKPENTVATFRMYGGQITNNDASANSKVDGGGIALGKADMELYGGDVSYNTAGTQNKSGSGSGAGDGGGIMVGTGSTLNMYGGTVSYNHAGGYGGGIVAWNGDINIHGGQIAHNTAAWGGGVGIAAAYGYKLNASNTTSVATSYVTMDGGAIQYNEAIAVNGAGGYGGGVCAGSGEYKKGAHLELTGGEISYNKGLYGGGAAVYADGRGTDANAENTAVVMKGSFTLSQNSANKTGNGMYILATSSGQQHTLVTLGGAAKIDTSNPVYFEEIGASQVPVLVESRLTTTGTAAIFEFSDAFWGGSHNGYGYASAGRKVIRFADGLDIQENKIALESTGWYLRTNKDEQALELQEFSATPQYTIRNGTPVTLDGKRYYRVYASLDDAFQEAADGDTLYIFYNTTVDEPAILEKKVTLLAESISSAALDAALGRENYGLEETSYDYYVMTGNFLKYVGGEASGQNVPSTSGHKYTIQNYLAALQGNRATAVENDSTGNYVMGDLSYNVRNDYTITLSSTLYLGESGKADATGVTPTAEGAIVVKEGATLEIGQVDTVGLGAGSLVFDGNVSSPVEGPMFQTSGKLILHSGITVEKHSNYSEAHPGAIEVTGTGELTMNSGVTIQDNVSPIAGAVFVNQGGKFNMLGGTIKNNYGTMPRYGYANEDGTKYTGYDTAYWGLPKYYYGAGAVYNLGDFAMSGGTVQNNRGEYGALANSGSGTMDLTGGTITENVAVQGTGEWYTDKADYELTIAGYTEGAKPAIPTEDVCQGAGTGGGIFISGDKDGSVSISNVAVTNNHAKVSGGGISVRGAYPAVKVIGDYTKLDGACQTVTVTTTTASGTTTGTKSIPAAEPDYEGFIGMLEHGVQVTLKSGTQLNDNDGGLFGGGLYAAGDGDSVTIQEGVEMKRNLATIGGGLAALRGASVTFSNEITENSAAWGGGVYVGGHKATGEGVTTVTARGRVTANESIQAGGGIYVDCLTTESAANLDEEPCPLPAAPGHSSIWGGAEEYEADEPGTNGKLILDGATVSNNRLGGDTYGVGVFNRGDVVLSAESGTQPTLSYNDQIYLEENHVVTLDKSYDITASGQSSTNPLTFRSYDLENGVALIQAATDPQALTVLNSGAFNHVERTATQRQDDRTVIEINSAFVYYYTDLPDDLALGTHSTYIYEPGASNVYALNFDAASRNQQTGEQVQGFTLPEGKNLSAWALIDYTLTKDEYGFDRYEWHYVKANGDRTDNVNEAVQYTPGSQLDVTVDRYLVAVYVNADYYVDTDFTFETLDPNADSLPLGSLEAANASFDASQKRYYFANDTELVLTPTPLAEGDQQGVLQGMSVWHMISADDYVADNEENYCTTNYLTTTYYWKRDLTARMETETFTMPEGNTETVTATGKITGLSNAPDFDETRASVTADGTGVHYRTPASSILVKAEFKQGMVKLEVNSETKASSFTGWYDTLHQAYEAAVEKVEQDANDYQITATLLASNTTDAAPEGYKGLTYLNGDAGNTGVTAVDRSGVEDNFSAIFDLNGYALDFQKLPTLNLDNMATTLKNGLIIHHAGALGSAENNIIEFKNGTLTVSDLTIQGEDAHQYAVKAGMGATLTIGKNCVLGDVYLESDAENPDDVDTLTEAAHTAVTSDFLDEQTADTVATLYFGRYTFPNGSRQAIIMDSAASESTGNKVRALFKLGDGETHEENEDIDHSTGWFIGTDGKLYKKIKAVVPQLVCANAGEGHKNVFTETKLDETWTQGYPLYYGYTAEYGYSPNEHNVNLIATVKDVDGNDFKMESGRMSFAVTLMGQNLRNRVYARVSSLSYDETTGRSLASVDFDSLCSLDANTANNYYVISVAWAGVDQYRSEYESYWDASGQDSSEMNSEGSIIGTSRLQIDPKALTSADVQVGTISPTQAEYIGPAGAAAGYTSSPTRVTMSDTARGAVMTEGSEYTMYFAALTQDETEAAANFPEAMEKDGVTYYYKDNGQGGKLYYTEGGSGDMSGLSSENAKNLNGAPVGAYSVALKAEGTNYTGESGWKEAVFTIAPYSGTLYLSGPNHVMAGEGHAYQTKTEEVFRNSLNADASRPLSVKDRYGNELKLANYSLNLEIVGGGATLENGWPASEGLYNLVARSNGHANGTLKLSEENILDGNYSPDAAGYMALLVTDRHLNIFIIPDTVSEPYTGSIYTDDMLKTRDGVDYEVWTVDVDPNSGQPLDENGSVITDLSKIKTEGRNATRMSTGEYRLEIGTAQHTPRDAGMYTMMVLDTAGKYRGLGYLNITDKSLGYLEVTPGTGVYTGLTQDPQVQVLDEDGRALTRGSDYMLTVANSEGRQVSAPSAAGVYTYTASGINNYSSSGHRNVNYTVLPKSLDNSDVTAANGLASVKLDAETVAIHWGTLAYAATPQFTLTYNGMTLRNLTDYTYVIRQNGQVVSGISGSGTYEITITGVNNYRGTISYTLTVLDGTSMGSLNVQNTGSYVYQASNFAGYNWQAAATVLWTNAAGTERSLDLNRCTVTVSRDMNGAGVVSGDTILDAGAYFVWVRPDADYAAELGLTENDPKGACMMTVERRPVTVTIASASKTYGQADPADMYNNYTTDLYQNGNSSPVSGGFYAKDTVSGSFTREEGENVRSGQYAFSLGTFSAGDNYVITVSQNTGLHVEPKDISVPADGADDMTVSYQDTMAYTGYGVSPVNAVTYNAELGNLLLAEKAHYQLNYRRWVPGTHSEGETCTPADTECGGHWQVMNAVPSDVGWYEVEINASSVLTAPDNYTGTRTLLFQIQAQGGVLDLSISGGKTVTYTAGAFTPSVAVYRRGFALPAGSYTLSYSFHPADGSSSGDTTGTFVSGVTAFTEAGEYTIYASGSGNFSGSAGSTVFTILPKSIASGDAADGTLPVDVTLTDNSFVYDGTARQAGVRASYTASAGGTAQMLTQDTDYTLAYRGHTDAGTATVTVTGKGNYTGSRELSYTIERAEVTVRVNETTKVYGTNDPEHTYTCTDEDGKTLPLTLTGRVGREAGEDAGEYAFRLDGSTLSAGNNYSLVLAEGQKLTITKKPLGDGKDMAANISASVPQYRSIDTNADNLVSDVAYWAPAMGKQTLTAGTDYTVTVTDANGDAVTGSLSQGTYTVTVAAAEGSVNYSGSFSRTVQIIHADALINMGSGGTSTYRVSGEDVKLTPFAGSTAENGKTFPNQEVNVTVTYSNGKSMETQTLTTDADGSLTLHLADAGTYTLVMTAHSGDTASGVETYFGTVTYVVQPKNISEGNSEGDGAATLKALEGDFRYTGGEVRPTNEGALLVYNGSTIPATEADGIVNYIVGYSNNVNPGTDTATLTVYGQGNYTGTRTVNYSIGETRYRITYRANEGSNVLTGSAPVSDELYRGGTSAVLQGSGNMTLHVNGEPGYDAVFLGWSETAFSVIDSRDQLNNAVLYSGGSSVTMQHDLTLYAVWAADRNNNGRADCDEDAARVTYSADVANDAGMTGIAPMDTNTYINGAAVTVKGNEGTLALQGYVFLGWTDTAPGTGGFRLRTSNEYINFVTANNLYTAGRTFIMGAQDVTLYSVWGVDANNNGKEDWRDNNQFFVAYDGNGGAGSLPIPEVLEAGVLNVTAAKDPNLTREGYVQIGWVVNQNGAGAPGVVTEKNQVNDSEAVIGGVTYVFRAFGAAHQISLDDPNPVIFYALWAEDRNNNGQPDYEETRYTVTYESVAADAKNPVLPEDGNKYLYKMDVVVKEAAAAKDANGNALAFLGWTYDKTAAERIYPRGETPTCTLYQPGLVHPLVNGNVTLYAVWGAADYNTQEYRVDVYYDQRGGTATESGTVLEGGSYTVTITPNASYELESVLVNRTEAKPVNNGDGTYTLTLTNITEDQFVVINFARSAFWVAQPGELSYTGEEQQLSAALHVKGGGKDLAYGKDYTITPDVGTEAGAYTVTVTGIGDYAGELAQSVVRISPAKLATLTVDERNFTYNGAAHAPAITEVTADGVKVELVENTHYEVAYENVATHAIFYTAPVQPGQYRLWVYGKGSVSGSLSADFTITTSGLSIGQVSNSVYDGMPYQPRPEVRDAQNNTVLKENADYLLSYDGDCINEGEHTLTVQGMGSYQGQSASRTYTIAKKLLDDSQANSGKITVTVASATYDGTEQTPEVSVVYTTADGRALLLIAGTDYDLAYSDNVTAGTGKVTVTGKGNYDGTIEATFSILPAGGKNLTVSSEPASKPYTGEEQEPTVTVKSGSTELAQGTDYTVTYTAVTGRLGENGKPLDAGLYTVSISGKDNYAGFSGTASFVITPIAMASAEVTGTYTYDGTAKTPAVTVKNAKGEILTEGKDYELRCSNNTNAGTAVVTAVGIGNYSGVLTAEFTIDRAVLTITPTKLGKTYGEQDGELTYSISGGSMNAPALSLTGELAREKGEDVGEYAFDLGSLRGLSGNYELQLNDSVRFTISPKSLGDGTASADGIEESLTTDGLEAGYTGAPFDTDLVIGYAAPNVGYALGLQKTRDYTLSFEKVLTDEETGETTYEPAPDAVNAGEYRVTVTGTGNYTGSFQFRLTITSANLVLRVDGDTAVTYNTQDQKPGKDKLIVTAGGNTLTEDQFTVRYLDRNGSEVKEFTNAGIYTIEVSAANHEPATVQFRVLQAHLTEDQVVQGPSGTYVYNGEPHEPFVTMVDEVKDSGYNLYYGPNTNAGYGSVTVEASGMGNYYGSVIMTFPIASFDLTAEGHSEVSTPANVEYTGSTLKQKPVVKADLNGDGTCETTLSENGDYTLSYSEDTVNVGTVTVTVTGRGNYEGVLAEVVSYQITPKTIQKSWLSVTPDVLTYSGSDLTPAVRVMDGDITLREGVDYELTYTDNRAVGTATVTVTGIGNYTGTPTANFEIVPNESSLSIAVTPGNTVTYNGENQRPTLTVTSGSVTLDAAEYTVTCLYNGTELAADAPFVNAGRYAITVNGTGSYLGATGTVFFTIDPASFEVEPIPDQKYTGRPVLPEPTVKADLDKDGTYETTLVYGTDFILSPVSADVINRGTVELKVSGVGNYAGFEQTVTYVITGEGALFKVIYDGNGATGGTMPADAAEYLPGATVTVLSGTPKRTGAVFLGWVPHAAPAEVVTSREEAAAYTTVYQAGAQLSMTEGGITLYALWGRDENGNGRPDYAENPQITASAGTGGTIAPSGKTEYVYGAANVAYTITVEDGYSFSGVTVDGAAVAVSTEEAPTALVKNENGTYTYTFASVTEDHVIVATFAKNGGGNGGGGGTPEPEPEPVVPERPDWNPNVPQLETEEHFAYVQGGSDGNFNPNEQITRAQVAVILARLMNGGMDKIPDGLTSSFTDVKPGAWYYNAVAYLERYNLINGMGDGTFQPDRSITRAEFAAMVMRYFLVDPYTGDPIFSDLDSDHWAYDLINSAHAYGFVQGYTDGSFAPDQKIRRAEAVVMLNRVLQRSADKEYIQNHQDALTTYPDVTLSHWAYYEIMEAANGHDHTTEKDGSESWTGSKN